MVSESFAFYISVLRKYFVSYCTNKMNELGVTYGQLFVLIYISKKGECSPKDITEYLKLDAGHLNRIITKLIEKDLITQRKNINDRRSNIVSLTDKGLLIVKESQKLFYEWDKEILSEIDDNSRKELMNLMKNIVFKLNEKMEEEKNE